ncbi:MAG: alanine racemase, partial [Lachnospiraceae bacterium]|nr:alanine racemase [Lachnospiraceae bacterium]
MNEIKLQELAESLGTPAFVFDIDRLKQRAAWVAEMIRLAKLCFAIKANPFLLGDMDELVERYEVCSPGEFHICVRNGLVMEKIVLSGVNKEYDDVLYAMKQGVIHYTAESKNQFELVHACAKELDRKVEILLRVTSGNQFGMSETDVRELIQHRAEYPHLKVKGLQYFTGTQKKIKKIISEVEYIEALAKQLEEEEGFVT